MYKSKKIAYTQNGKRCVFEMPYDLHSLERISERLDIDVDEFTTELIRVIAPVSKVLGWVSKPWNDYGEPTARAIRVTICGKDVVVFGATAVNQFKVDTVVPYRPGIFVSPEDDKITVDGKVLRRGIAESKAKAYRSLTK